MTEGSGRRHLSFWLSHFCVGITWHFWLRIVAEAPGGKAADGIDLAGNALSATSPALATPVPTEV